MQETSNNNEQNQRQFRGIYKLSKYYQLTNDVAMKGAEFGIESTYKKHQQIMSKINANVEEHR